MGVFDTVKAAAGAVAGAAGDLLGAGLDKVKGWIDEITAASPHFQEVGYRVSDLHLEMALTPRVIIELLREFEAGEEAFQAVLASNAEHKMFCAVVAMLQKANQVDRRLQLKGRRFKGLAVELGLPPVARLTYAEAPAEKPSTAS